MANVYRKARGADVMYPACTVGTFYPLLSRPAITEVLKGNNANVVFLIKIITWSLIFFLLFFDVEDAILRADLLALLIFARWRLLK